MMAVLASDRLRLCRHPSIGPSNAPNANAALLAFDVSHGVVLVSSHVSIV